MTSKRRHRALQAFSRSWPWLWQGPEAAFVRTEQFQAQDTREPGPARHRARVTPSSSALLLELGRCSQKRFALPDVARGSDRSPERERSPKLLIRFCALSCIDELRSRAKTRVRLARTRAYIGVHVRGPGIVTTGERFRSVDPPGSDRCLLRGLEQLSTPVKLGKNPC